MTESVCFVAASLNFEYMIADPVVHSLDRSRKLRTGTAERLLDISGHRSRNETE